MGKGYNNFLTVLLVIVILAIIGLVGMWLYDAYSKYSIEKEALSAITEFENAIMQNNEIPVEDTNIEGENEFIEETEKPEVEGTNGTNSNKGSKKKSSTSKPKTFRGFTIAGYIEIPKTKKNLPVLEKVTGTSLQASVAILYGPGLNKPGNTIIVGHNNRNGTQFSNNKKIAIGDKIYITDLSGNKVTYIVYNTYETTPEDSYYMTRNTNGAREISLSTCNDDSSKRIIIWAKEQ